MSTQEKHKFQGDNLTEAKKDRFLILHNDDIHTFDYVIDSLIDTCDHTLVQAEQCTYLVHFKGKCAVKTGEYEELKARCSKLLDLGLSAEIV